MKNHTDFLTSMLRAIVPESNNPAPHMHKRIRQWKIRVYSANGYSPYVPRVHGYCKL